MFFTCFHYDVNDDLVEVNACNHCHFANAVIESFPSRIWWSIVLVKEKEMKLLCDQSSIIQQRKWFHFHFPWKDGIILIDECRFVTPFLCNIYGNKCINMYTVT